MGGARGGGLGGEGVVARVDVMFVNKRGAGNRCGVKLVSSIGSVTGNGGARSGRTTYFVGTLVN